MSSAGILDPDKMPNMIVNASNVHTNANANARTSGLRRLLFVGPVGGDPHSSMDLLSLYLASLTVDVL